MFPTTRTTSRTAATLALFAALAGILVSSALGSSPPAGEYATWLAGPHARVVDGRSPDTRDAAQRAQEARAAVSQRLVQLASAGFARGVLETRFGFSPARAESWTTGACSYRDRPPSCYLSPARARSTAQAEATSLGASRHVDPHQLPHA